MAEPASLNARLIPLPIRDPNRPIGQEARPPEPRPARVGPDGFAAPALPGANPRLSNGQGIRPPARGEGTGIGDRPRNPGDIGAAPRLEQRPPVPLAQADARPFAQAQDQRFDPPQRLLDLLDAQRGREVAAEITRQTREALFGQPDVTDTSVAEPAATFPVEPGPEVAFQPATDERPAFQRIADLAVEFRAADARRAFAAVQAEQAAVPALAAPPRALIDQRV